MPPRRDAPAAIAAPHMVRSSEVVDQARYAVDRHWPGAANGELAVEQEVGLRRDRDDAVDGRVLDDKVSAENGSGSELLCKVPRVQGLRGIGPEESGNDRGFVAVFGEPFLVAEYFVVLGGDTGRVDFLLQHGLLTDVRESRPVEVEPGFAGPHAVESLLIREIGADRDDADDEAVFSE